jgi:hypothetical protein
LDRHVFTCALSTSELERRNPSQNSKKKKKKSSRLEAKNSVSKGKSVMWGLALLYTAKVTTGNRKSTGHGPVRNLQEKEK